MGLTHVTVTVTPLTGRKKYEAEFLVDTGAIDCLVPASALKKIVTTSERYCVVLQTIQHCPNITVEAHVA